MGMKIKILFILLASTVSVCAEGYWIQVLNVKEDVLPLFIKKVQHNAQGYKVLDTSSGQKVLVGSYESRADAEQALNLIRCRIASDAFIVKEDSALPFVEQVPEKLAVIAGNKPGAQSNKPVKKETVVSKKTEDAEPAENEPCICIYDKRALRKSEIANAMAFYRNSSDYTFTGEDEIVPGF